ncbi:histone deacetylase [Pichia kluyveri]|uniref:Histone deacetylase n=1 Tax=Pichia kluyveri TaxID=36015 RepID=A0AAV5R8V6_PICKL|nr:histone deacetylase [Pichia kluyveri]
MVIETPVSMKRNHDELENEIIIENGQLTAPTSVSIKTEDSNGDIAMRDSDEDNNNNNNNNGNNKDKLNQIVETLKEKLVVHEDSDIIVSPQKPDLSYILLKTGLVYDVRMRYHAKIYTSYFEYIDPHPEDPRRIYRIYKILAEHGLITDPTLSGSDEIGDYMLKLPIREASKEEILAVHTEEHLKFIESTHNMNKEELLKQTEKGDSVYFNNDSLLSAKLSCGGAIEACKAVVEGKVKNALAVVRPPGHHAEPQAPGGFCLFSNVAVAATAILKSYPESVRKIVIIDWDIHHGNGTQKVFFNDPRVLYISLHRYEQGKYYPGTNAGGADQVGEGLGEGRNVNIPWPVGGVGDADYIYAFRKVVMPICNEFQPDLVIISSGFDAADGDVIGGCHVSPAGYGQMTHMLKSLAKGNLCVVLEGGYNLDSIAKSALRVAKVLIGEPPEELKVQFPKTESIEVIDDVIKIQSKYWKSLSPGYLGLDFNLPNIMGNYDNLIKSSPDPTFIEVAAKHKRINDSIRDSQRLDLFEKFNFSTLPLLTEKLPNSTSINESTILCSPDIYNNDKLVIIVHDPSRIWARRDPITGDLDSANAVTVDKSLNFIEWALKEKWGVLDINIPITVSGKDDIKYNNITTSQDIMLYLWDNFLKFFKVEKIAFVGVGEAYNGIIHLCGHRDVRKLVKASINFVDKATALRAIISTIDESIVDWFFRNSLVFTSNKHSCWGDKDSANSKRPRKKYGRVLRADVEGLDGIIDERFDEVCTFIQESMEDYDSDSDSEA